MITFFACPKPFHGHTSVIQRNAIKSWTLLRPKPDVILLGVDEGVADLCEEFALIHIPGIDRNEYGTPFVNSIFQVAQERATYPIVCYVNSDIILMSDFIRAVQTVAAQMRRFLVLGQRTDIEINKAWPFAADWEAGLKSLLAQKGTLHPASGIDFFCFPRGMYTDVPAFAIGRRKWDNWLVWRARTQGVPIVDVTEAVLAAHQDHGNPPDEIEIRAPDGHWVELGPETRRNIALVSEEQNLNIWAATWMIDRQGRLRHRRLTLTPAYLYYQLKRVVPLYWPAFGRVFRRIVSFARALHRGGRHWIRGTKVV